MKLNTYISKRNAIVDVITNSFDFWSNDDSVRKFNLVSAGLTNFLPQIHHSKHEGIYRGVLIHQNLSILEQEFFHTLDYANYENLDETTLRLLKEKPTIICTFHTGSYRLINHFLTKAQIPYTLVIASDVLKTQGKQIQQLYSEYYEGYLCDELTLIDAEHPSSGLQMMRELKKGKSLLLYIDGNTGAGTATTQNLNNCNVRFLNQSISARKGIAYLAHAARVPIINALCYRKSLEDIRIRFHAPIIPDPDECRADFAERTTQLLFDQAVSIIEKYPEQWEAWVYLHKVTNLINKPSCPEAEQPDSRPAKRFSFNASQFGVFKIAKSSFLFDKFTYASYEINGDVYASLFNSRLGSVSKRDFSMNIFRQLFENRVLLPA